MVRGFLAQRAEGDPRIRIAEEPHRGLTASLNRGLALARGAWIARQDADDWSEPARLERQVELLPGASGDHGARHRCLDASAGRASAVAAASACDNTTTFCGDCRRGNPFVHGSVMFPRAAAVAAGGYREEFRCSQDYDFLWRLAERGSAANLAEPLYHYRYTSGSVSAGRAAEQARAHRAIQRLASCASGVVSAKMSRARWRRREPPRRRIRSGRSSNKPTI